MGVYIKGMEMPDSCLRCSLFAGNGCKATNRIFPDWLNVAARPSACPLVEIKAPHGRLIDVKSLGAPDVFEMDWGWSEEKVEIAPTVIEAEEENK